MLPHFRSIVEVDFAGMHSVITYDATIIEGLLDLYRKSLCDEGLNVRIDVLAFFAKFRHELLEGEAQ